ncbi:outer membrane protein with beta-barrel domain [Alteromonadaceae bacterium 2753L.S.0a.02]|nr:outer membrane protein with beta-barrel domain [Alteromonadaceae bacterium 2753L.S.0a.02]
MKHRKTQAITLPSFSLILLITVIIPRLALAEPDTRGFYLGGMLGKMTISENSPDYDLNENTELYGVLMGYHITRNFGVEQTILIGSDDNFFSQSLSIAPKATVFFNDKLSIFGKLGLAASLLTQDVESDEYGWWDNQSGFGFTLGAGINLALTDSLYLGARYDYLKIDMEDSDNRVADTDFDFDCVTMNLYYQF